MKKFLLLLVSSFLAFALNAQDAKISGTVSDQETGEPLIGANVIIASGQGAATDIDGHYSVDVKYGTYNVEVSYLGYEKQSVSIHVNQPELNLDIALAVAVQKEIKVIADVAISRETPVAFSNIGLKELKEDLSTRDIPLILNSTPGVYATQQGGGDGDARITIRGFDQRNIAVMIDGVPVNDMENGWVYWSNWFGLDAITKTIQVQRGLGASKLALPSVGGTMNILTKGMDNKSELSLKTEFSSDDFSGMNKGFVQSRTSLGVNSGKLKGDWGISLAASYKTGKGWVDGTNTQGVFYYARIDKRFKEGKHAISLTGYGAPQQHGQRSYALPIASYDKAYAEKLGIDVSDSALAAYDHVDRGIRFNESWGYLDRYTITEEGDTIASKKGEQVYNTQTNYYHKPQLMLRHMWSPNDKFFLSTTVYTSIGNGGGTAPQGPIQRDDSTGQLLPQIHYDANMTRPSGEAKTIMRSSVNSHFWVGALSTFNYKFNEKLELSGGLDYRNYKGIHYREVKDLFGGEYFIDNTGGNANTFARPVLGENGVFYYNNIGKVNWGGAFALLEYKHPKFSTFFNATVAVSAYKKIDYFAKRDLIIEGEKYDQMVGWNDTVTINGKAYTIESEEAKPASTPWVTIPGYTFKAGFNYKVDKRNNVFVNIGYLNKVAPFNNVIDRNKVGVASNHPNEKILGAELGGSLKSRYFSANLNGYSTYWLNRPLTITVRNPSDPDESEYVNVPGIKAFHAGLELDFSVQPHKMIAIEGLFSYGDWRWKSGVDFNYTFSSGDTAHYSFDATNVHVGDAAQLQAGLMLRVEPVKNFYIKPRITYFGKHFANFTPESLKGDNERRESWKIPDYYNLDCSFGYSYWTKKKIGLNFRGNLYNITNVKYISDATNNDNPLNAQNFDASSATVFFGRGFNWSVGLEIVFSNFIKKEQ